MNQEKQPEAMRLADALEYISNNSEENWQAFDEAAAELRRLHARNTEQRAELVTEAARTAEEKLRANQMTEQHRMQCNMHASDYKKLEGYVGALTAAEHRIADLEAQLSAVGAGGVESLRKRDADLIDDVFSPGKGSKAARRMQAAQPSRECLLQSAEEVCADELRSLEGKNFRVAVYERAANLIERQRARISELEALQAAPPAPASVAVPDAKGREK